MTVTALADEPDGRPDSPPPDPDGTQATDAAGCPPGALPAGTTPPADRPATGRDRRGRPVDAGMSTAEYAVGTVAACALAAVLFAIVRSAEVQQMLLGIIRRALDLTF